MRCFIRITLPVDCQPQSAALYVTRVIVDIHCCTGRNSYCEDSRLHCIALHEICARRQGFCGHSWVCRKTKVARKNQRQHDCRYSYY